MVKIFLIGGIIVLSSTLVRAQNETSKQIAAPSAAMVSQPQIASGKTSDLTANEIATLVRECGERTTRMSAIIFYNYSYAQTESEFEYDKQGRAGGEKSKGFEMYPVRGRSPVRVQTSENGVPLKPEKIERERERALAELLEAERKAANAPPQPAAVSAVTQPPVKSYSSFGIVLTQRTSGGFGKMNYPLRPTDFLVSHEFYAPRRVPLDNRETVLLRFRPRPDFVFDKSNLSFGEGIDGFNRIMRQLGGRIWIDAADKTIARLEAFPVDDANFAEFIKSDEPDPNAPLGFESARLPNGVWTPRRNWLNGYAREKIFGKLTPVSRAVRFGDFKAFQTEVKAVELNAPKTAP